MKVMASVCQYSLCILYLFGFAISFDIDPTEIHDDDLDIRPDGKETTVERELGGYKCVFTYKAEGGTDERWKIILEVDESKDNFVCIAKRAGTSSYLFFEMFELEISGGEVQKVDIKLPGGDPMPEDQYILKGNKVKNAGKDKFKSALNEVSIWALGGDFKREEL